MQTTLPTGPIVHQQGWSTDRIRGLAPNLLVANSGVTSATSDRWQALGFGDDKLWGEFPARQNKVTRTQIHLKPLAAVCSCTNRSFPCSHIIGLLLIAHNEPQRFTPKSPPDWLQPPLSKSDYANSGQASISDARRLDDVRAGMAELEIWLRDMVHQGLAELANRPKIYWTRMIDRLIDARADEIAQQLRTVSTLPGTTPDWPQQLLRQIGKLYLLTRGFDHYEALPRANQADLQSAVGWLPAINPNDSVTDEWLVLGRTIRPIAKRNIQHTWLTGIRSGRSAVIKHELVQQTGLQPLYPTGAILTGTALFRHGAAPMSIVFEHPPATILSNDALISENRTISAEFQRFNQTIAANPWLQLFPMWLDAVWPVHDNPVWHLRDASGFIVPLDPEFSVGWYLLAKGGGQPITLFGTWNGADFQPVSTIAGGECHDLHIVRGIK
jgi:hypothetical protein